MTKDLALRDLYPRALYIPFALVLSMITLILGLFLPVIKLKELVFWKHTFSVLSGISSLWDEGHYVLSLIILLFSVVFPFLKLVTLFFVWFDRMSFEKRTQYVRWLSILGKWSMLDVFVVAITIVIAKISSMASAEPQVGIYFFGFSISLAILVTTRIEHLIKLSAGQAGPR